MRIIAGQVTNIAFNVEIDGLFYIIHTDLEDWLCPEKITKVTTSDGTEVQLGKESENKILDFIAKNWDATDVWERFL